MKTRETHHIRFSAALLIAGLFSSSWANTHVVTHTADSGAGSLRQAMMDADVNGSGPDTIVFNIPRNGAGYDAASGTWTIRPLMEMRNLVLDGGTVIDGTTQAAFIGGDPNPLGPEIVVDGSLAGDEDGFIMDSNNNALTGLVIHGFKYSQIRIGGDGNRVSGCYIGLDADGARFERSGIRGIFMGECSWNTIGGASESDRNVVSGNSASGIEITDHSERNSILGNYIGIRADGSDTLGNKGSGVLINRFSSRNTIGPGNVISGNREYGIWIRNDSVGHNRIVGNRIGTDTSGTRAW